MELKFKQETHAHKGKKVQTQKMITQESLSKACLDLKFYYSFESLLQYKSLTGSNPCNHVKTCLNKKVCCMS